MAAALQPCAPQLTKIIAYIDECHKQFTDFLRI